MIVLKAAVREEFASHKCCADLVRVDTIPCDNCAVLMLKEAVVSSLKVDKLAAVLGGEAAYDIAVFIHAGAHAVGAARLHEVRCDKKNAADLIFCACYHLAEVALVFLGSARFARDARNVELSPHVVDADADADVVGREGENIAVIAREQVAARISADTRIRNSEIQLGIPCVKHILDNADIAAPEIIEQTLADGLCAAHVGYRVACKYYSVVIFEYHLVFGSLRGASFR